MEKLLWKKRQVNAKRTCKALFGSARTASGAASSSVVGGSHVHNCHEDVYVGVEV